MRALVAGGAAALLVAGCAVGPDYHRPTTPVPASYEYEPAEAAQTADTDWWKQLGDPVLDEMITQALANNKNLKIATANVAQAAGILTQSRAPLFPEVHYGGTAARYRFSDSTIAQVPVDVPNPTTYYTALAGASWEIDLWGRIRRLSQAAQANLLATEEARHGVVLTVVTQVAISYIQLRAVDEQLEIADRTLVAYGQSLKLTQDKFKYGQTSQMTVAQVQSQYETVASKIPDLRNQRVVLETSLSVLLGNNPGEIPRGKSIRELTAPAVPAGVPSELLERRPDILQAEEQLASATAQIGAAKAQYFPSISLTGAFGSGSTALHDLFQGPTRLWNYAGNITGPIFAGESIAGQVRQAEAGQQAALFNYQRVIQNAFADVDQTLSARQQLVEQVGAEERLVAALQTYSRLAHLQYDGGYAPYSTVLQAEQQLFPSELNLAQARGQLLTSLVSIYGAIGGSWVTHAGQ
jgi:outer membrane protein, multidrug efflux system